MDLSISLARPEHLTAVFNSSNPHYYYATGLLGTPSEQPDDINGAYPAGKNTTDGGRHNGGSNYLCCDGHVKWLYGRQVSPGKPNNDMNCGQNITDQGGSKCTLSVDGYAAGTANTSFTITFSPL